MKGFLGLLLFLTTSGSLHSETVLVSILNKHSCSAILISPDKGSYRLEADGAELFVLEKNELLYVSMKGEELFLSKLSGSPGIFSSVSLVSAEGRGGFTVRSVVPLTQEKYYYGNLNLSVDYERIKMINAVDEDIYLAGVVEAESGTSSTEMFYKAHSIICRTYLYNNLDRHMDEGFHLCDEVHCQVYKGRLTSSGIINDAVSSTSGKVITYGNGDLITAAFHSNCGGQTVNSQDIWLISRPYLRSVHDPYCRYGKNAKWKLNVGLDEWRSYLRSMGISGSHNLSDPSIFCFSQQSRSVFYRIENSSIPLRQIRSDWNLKSAFFEIDIAESGQEVIIRGKGYGHGAGLCQEGAMEMAARGYNFLDILQFYYTDISVRDIDSLVY